MKGRALAEVGGVLMVALAALVPLEAKAFPFEATPDGFLTYLNSIDTWESGNKYKFIKANPNNCNGMHKGEKMHWFGCNVDYIETSSLGERTCINTNIDYNFWGPGETRFFKMGECSEWQKVSATPEPQPATTPPPQEPSQPAPATTTTTATCVDNNLILAGGAGIFFVGGILGIAFSQLLGRKKD
jgi:hypothetical protein